MVTRCAYCQGLRYLRSLGSCFALQGGHRTTKRTCDQELEGIVALLILYNASYRIHRITCYKTAVCQVSIPASRQRRGLSTNDQNAPTVGLSVCRA